MKSSKNIIQQTGVNLFYTHQILESFNFFSQPHLNLAFFEKSNLVSWCATVQKYSTDCLSVLKLLKYFRQFISLYVTMICQYYFDILKTLRRYIFSIIYLPQKIMFMIKYLLFILNEMHKTSCSKYCYYYYYF